MISQINILFEKYADFVLITAFIILFEIFAFFLALKASKKGNNQPTTRMTNGVNSALTLFLNCLIDWSFAISILMIKHLILKASYSVATGITGFEGFLLFCTLLFLFKLIVMVIDSSIYVSTLLMSIIVFYIAYTLPLDVFSRVILTDRIIAAEFVSLNGYYLNGFLDPAYDPMAFDVSLYSFLSLVTGVGVTDLSIPLSYMCTVAALYVTIWKNLSAVLSNKELILQKATLLFIVLLHLSNPVLNPYTHEALWSSWLLILLYIYVLLSGSPISKLTNVFISILLVVSAVFYHITTIIMVLPFSILVFICYIISTSHIRRYFYVLIQFSLFSIFKVLFLNQSVITDFANFLEKIISLQFHEEAGIYLRANYITSPSMYLRYSQLSLILIPLIGFASLIFYLFMFMISLKRPIKQENWHNFIHFSLLLAGLVLLIFTGIAISIGGILSTSFIRPGLFLLLTGSCVYIIKRTRTILKHRSLLIVSFVLIIIPCCFSIHDPTITPRKGLYVPFIFTNDFDVKNLDTVFNDHLSTDCDTLLIGYPEVLMYVSYLKHVVGASLCATYVGSTKVIREFYENIGDHTSSLAYVLFATLNNFDVRHAIEYLNLNALRLYDSGAYLIHRLI